MHVVCVSYYYERFLTSPTDLLERYPTLTQWADGLAGAGARVSVVQRFGRDADIRREGVLYRFVRAPHPRFGSLLDPARRVNQAVAALVPDIVHANGSSFARQAARLKTLLPHVPVVLQDHANRPPSRWLSRTTLRRAMRAVDAVSFTVPQQMLPWQQVGIVPADKPLLLLPEGTSTFRLQSRQEARECTGLYGHPFCLWVGRLNANKDPLTVLQGFGHALSYLPNALLVMVYSAADLLPQVQDWLHRHPHVAAHVLLMGKLPHEALEDLYNSADFFLTGSDYDGGSGYSVLEALSCGVVPIITDIPSFRAVTDNGKFGGLWPVGDAEALARTLLDWHARLTPDTPQQIRAYFQANHSLVALGSHAVEAYGRLLHKEGRV
jgi:glycosyltransferase involved in cell wall biosynthesis